MPKPRKEGALTPRQIREQYALLLPHMPRHEAAQILAAQSGYAASTIGKIIENQARYWHHDPDYTPPPALVPCAECGSNRPVCAFSHEGGTRDAVCRRCRSGVYTTKYYKYYSSKPKPTRDGVDEYKHLCPVCGMGVDRSGDAFESQADADKCCEGVPPAHEAARKRPTRGKYSMPRGRAFGHMTKYGQVW